MKSWAKTTLNISIVLAAILTSGIVAFHLLQRKAPQSASEPVNPTADGLARLFREECIEQRDRQWVHEESTRVRSSCDTILGENGEIGDCKQNRDGQVSWYVPTTTGSQILVTLSWWQYIAVTGQAGFGPPQHHLSCSIAVDEKFGPVLEKAVSKIIIDHSTLRGPSPGDVTSDPTLDRSLVWHTRLDHNGFPLISLDHYLSMEKYRAKLRQFRQGSMLSLSAENLLASHKIRAQKPWELSYTPKMAKPDFAHWQSNFFKNP